MTVKLIGVIAASFVLACSGDPGGAAPLPPELRDVAEDARVHHARIVLASYADSLALAGELDRALVALVDEPSEAALDGARRAYLDARDVFMQTEVFRFSGGPIDDESGLHDLLNAWPLEASTIDYVADDPEAGTVNDPEQPISPDALASANLQGGETSVTTGYHVIEFLLWGEDRSESGPGERPHTDYVTDGSGTADHQDRRGAYLLAASELLREHLALLVDAWRAGASNHRTAFLNAPWKESLSSIVAGVRLLSLEMSAEWLEPALETREREHEQSDFSDETRRDIVRAVEGMQNVWTGSYARPEEARIQGTGLYAVLRVEDRALADQAGRRLEHCLELAAALEQPFDREIAPDNPDGRARVEALADELSRFERDVGDSVSALGLGR